MAKASQAKLSAGELLERWHDDEALAELGKRKGDAAKLATRKLRGLKPGFSGATGWLCRVLESVAPDPFGILLSVLPGANYDRYRSFAIAGRSWARPEDAPRILAVLKKLVLTAFPPSGKCELPETLDQNKGITGVSILLEALARLDPVSIREPARALFAAARERLSRPPKKESYASLRRRVDFLPLLAASAATLLASAETDRTVTAKECRTWETACVQAALDPAMYPENCSYGPPLSFLLVGSPQLAGKLILRLMKEAKDPASILTQIASTLREARNMGLQLTIALPACPEESTAQKSSAIFAEGTDLPEFAGIGDWAVMEIRRSQNPEAFVTLALRGFRNARIETSLIQDALSHLGNAVTGATFPAIMVEAMLAKRTSEKNFASVRETEEQKLNMQLKRAGRQQFKGLLWKSPPGKQHGLHELDSLKALEETLCAIHEAIRATKTTGANSSGTDITAAFFRDVFPHTLCRHAIYRDLICGLRTRQKKQYPDLLALLPDTKMENDAGMIRMIANWCGQDSPAPFNAILALFLDHQLLKSDMVLLEQVVACLARAPEPAFNEPLKGLKRYIAEAVPKNAPKRCNAVQAIDELLLALGNADSVSAFPAKINGKTFVSTEEKMTMLQLAAAEKIMLEQGCFEKLFSEAIESEHLVFTEWTAAITGRQVREYIMKILRDSKSPNAKVISVARYCYWARKDGIPALALAPILDRLGPAVEAARNNPGETWEDRDWAGYTTSGAEDLADALSCSVKGFVSSDCTAIGWHELVSELTRVHTGDLRKLKLGESSSCGFTFSTINLINRLDSKLARMNDLKLSKAVLALRNR